MSDQNEDDKEIEAIRQQIEQKAEENKAEAAVVEEPSPSPELVVFPPTEAPAPASPVQEAPTPSTAQAEDDPMAWAEKKGLKTPEDMARALRQKEQEFHKRNQAGHPGYQDVAPAPQAPPPPQWQPAPVMQPPPYYPPPIPSRMESRDNLARKYGMDPEDVDRLMPLIVDAADAIAARRTSGYERKIAEIEATTGRNNELMSLSQDPAFHDNRVQREIHSILDSDPSIFQRERAPYAAAFSQAMVNLARKQLQQGGQDQGPPMTNRPPVTASGGNGSANTMPQKMTPEAFERLSVEDQKAYLVRNGGGPRLH